MHDKVNWACVLGGDPGTDGIENNVRNDISAAKPQWQGMGYEKQIV